MAPRDELSASQLFAAGAISGVVECLTVQPLDMAKTRVQLMSAQSNGLTHRPSVVGIISALIREGGIPRLYRGVLPELAAMMPKQSAMYASYEGAVRLLRPRLGDSAMLHGVAGFAAGTPEALVVTPFQVVKVRLQAREHLGRYRGTVHCVQTVLRDEGALALMTGLHATIWRNSIWNSVYFASMHSLRRSFPLPEASSAAPSSSFRLSEGLRTLLFGFVAGVAATCCNNPFDVVKSRMQAELRTSAKGGPATAAAAVSQSDSVLIGEAGFQRLREIWQAEGLQGLYVGFTPKALRMGLGGAVGMFAFEAAAAAMVRAKDAT